MMTLSDIRLHATTPTHSLKEHHRSRMISSILNFRCRTTCSVSEPKRYLEFYMSVSFLQKQNQSHF